VEKKLTFKPKLTFACVVLYLLLLLSNGLLAWDHMKMVLVEKADIRKREGGKEHNYVPLASSKKAVPLNCLSVLPFLIY